MTLILYRILSTTYTSHHLVYELTALYNINTDIKLLILYSYNTEVGILIHG